MKSLNDLQETEVRKALDSFFRSTEGRQIGRLVTAERSKGPAGNITDCIADMSTIFRAMLRELYLQPPPRQIGEP